MNPGSRDPRDGARLAGVVLAGGASRRMGRPKAGLEWAGDTFLGHVVAALAAAKVDPIVVVAGTHRAAAAAALGEPARARIVVNPHPERGQLSSLKVALRDLAVGEGAGPPGGVGPCGAVVALVDHPAVHASTVAALVEAALAEVASAEEVRAGAIPSRSEDRPRSGTSRRPAAGILIPTFDGRRGHPVVFLRPVWAELLDAPDAFGAKPVVRRDPGRVREVAVEDPGILIDVDTPADLAALPDPPHARSRP